jgi:hypothetical protein
MACVLGNAVLDLCKDCFMPLTSPKKQIIADITISMG